MSTKVKDGAQALPEFTGWRARLWPIHNFELKKFLPLGFIMFCLLFNYTVLRDTKDTLVVNSAGAGAITFLKLYCVTPAAILFVILYAELANKLSREAVFYAVVTPFVIFFALFGFFIYPNLDVLHPDPAYIQSLHEAHPRWGGFIDLYAYWSYSLFYVLSEIWGSAMISLMFWQFANYIVRMSESKRFYGLFVVIGNLSLVFSGQAVRFCSKEVHQFFPEVNDPWQISLYFLMGLVAIIGIAAMLIYRWTYTNVLTDKRYFDPEEAGTPKKKKEKPGLVESFKIIMTSPELGYIAILLIAYGVTINLVEVQWKHQLKIFYAGDKGGYNAFMGNYSTVTGIVTILFSLFIGSNLLRKLSWFSAAVITPVAISIGGVLFFCFIMAQDQVEALLSVLNTDAVTAATFLGAAIVIISKVIKYALFDPTKEMAYIPLDDELKTKGKAAVDVIGGRAGKSGGAFAQSTLLLIFATKNVIAIAPMAFVVFGVFCLLWLVAVKGLSKKVAEALVRKKAAK
jgi:AAA family ATP:ADP antiporter